MTSVFVILYDCHFEYIYVKFHNLSIVEQNTKIRKLDTEPTFNQTSTTHDRSFDNNCENFNFLRKVMPNCLDYLTIGY